jgi:hypothetical protein
VKTQFRSLQICLGFISRINSTEKTRFYLKLQFLASASGWTRFSHKSIWIICFALSTTWPYAIFTVVYDLLCLVSNSANHHRLEMKEKLGLSFITRPINNNKPFLYFFILKKKNKSTSKSYYNLIHWCKLDFYII